MAILPRSNVTDSLAFDTKGLDQLKASAKTQGADSLKKAATQFEALFLNMIVKSMREAGSHDGIFDSEQSKMYTSMLDQQLTQIYWTGRGCWIS